MAKGSGIESAARLFIVIVVLVAALLGTVGLGLVHQPAQQRVACIDNLNGLSQTQYRYLVSSLTTNPGFIAATSGRCFDFDSGFEVSGPSGGNIYLVFDHISPHVIYPCRSVAVHEVDERLQVSPIYNASGGLLAFQIENLGVQVVYHCTPAEIRVEVYPVIIQEVNGSSETVSMTLLHKGLAITSLNATLVLPNGNFTAVFAGVSDSNPLAQESTVVQSVDLPLGAMKTWTPYLMVEKGRFYDGMQFDWTLIVQLEG